MLRLFSNNSPKRFATGAKDLPSLSSSVLHGLSEKNKTALPPCSTIYFTVGNAGYDTVVICNNAIF